MSTHTSGQEESQVEYRRVLLRVKSTEGISTCSVGCLLGCIDGREDGCTDEDVH